MDTSGDIDGVINGINGVIEGDGGFGVEGLLFSSDFIDQVVVLSTLDEVFLSDGEGGDGLSLGDGTDSELSVGLSQGYGGIEDFRSSVTSF